LNLTGALRSGLRSRTVLLLAFAFAVMGDPVSSVAYAIEAALRALHGDLGLLLATIGLVLAIITLVSLNYHQLYARFPEGGGDAAATGAAFGEGWAFLPLGSLIVDYTLTIAISVAAGASAIIAYLPGLAPARVPLALGLLVLVAGLTWFGHGGRSVFVAMTVAFVVVALAVVARGYLAPVARGAAPLAVGARHRSGIWTVLLAFPVAMALATGVEAPSSAIAQLGQLDDRGRRRFGRATLWLMLAIVVTLTVGLAGLAVRLHVGVPPADSTQIAALARASAGRSGLFAAFQITTVVLLLAAASSSFQAGPGLLKGARARRRRRSASAPARTDERPPHTLLGRPHLPRRLHGDRGCRRRPRATSGAVLRGRRVHRLPLRPPRHGALLPPGTTAAASRRQPHRCTRGQRHARPRPRPRIPDCVADRRLPHCGRTARALGEGRGGRAASPSPRPSPRQLSSATDQRPSGTKTPSRFCAWATERNASHSSRREIGGADQPDRPRGGPVSNRESTTCRSLRAGERVRDR
jgi:hypothetical protein